jgi:hypothetical protein
MNFNGLVQQIILNPQQMKEQKLQECNVNLRIQSTSAVIYTRALYRKECHLVLTGIKGSLLFYVKENKGHAERIE